MTTDTGLRLRAVERHDFPLLSRWMAADHVRRWWREDPGRAAVEARYGPAVDGGDPTELLLVESDGVAVAFTQRYRLGDDDRWLASLAPSKAPADGFGLDYLIGEETHIGRGLGPQIIRALVADGWTRYPEASAAVVAVAEDNRRSWRALEKAGFVRIWSGTVVSDDPSDEGPSHVYLCPRPSGSTR